MKYAHSATGHMNYFKIHNRLSLRISCVTRFGLLYTHFQVLEEIFLCLMNTLLNISLFTIPFDVKHGK